MNIKTITDEDFTNYKKPSMVIAFPFCTFKCEKEYGEQVCQNGTLAAAPTIEVDPQFLVQRYVGNQITSAVVMAGLEAFDSYEDLKTCITAFRKRSCDDIVIFTGYNKSEVINRINELSALEEHIIVKFGRYIPGCESHYDDILGVFLASDNQFAERIS